MTKKQKRAMKRIKKVVEDWKWIVTRYGWQFDVYYCRADEYPDEVSEGGTGIVYSQFQYLEGSIYFNLDKMKRFDERRIEDIVVHELVHLLLRPLQESEDNVEYTTQSVARVLLMLGRM